MPRLRDGWTRTARRFRGGFSFADQEHVSRLVSEAPEPVHVTTSVDGLVLELTSKNFEFRFIPRADGTVTLLLDERQHFPYGWSIVLVLGAACAARVGLMSPSLGGFVLLAGCALAFGLLLKCNKVEAKRAGALRDFVARIYATMERRASKNHAGSGTGAESADAIDSHPMTTRHATP